MKYANESFRNAGMILSFSTNAQKRAFFVCGEIMSEKTPKQIKWVKLGIRWSVAVVHRLRCSPISHRDHQEVISCSW